MYVPWWENLRREVIRECHDSKWASYPGIHGALALSEDRSYWPDMREDVATYVKTCLICQQDKLEKKNLDESPQPLQIPERA